jgi:hypothetical protein
MPSIEIVGVWTNKPPGNAPTKQRNHARPHYLVDYFLALEAVAGLRAKVTFIVTRYAFNNGSFKACSYWRKISHYFSDGHKTSIG